MNTALKAGLVALVAVPVLTACDDTYANAACIDTQTQIQLPPSACSPNYGAPIGYHSWAYSPYSSDDVDVVYVGSRVPNTYVLTRPRNLDVTHIAVPAPIRPPGVPASVSTVKQPSARVIQRNGFGGIKSPTAPVPNRTLNSPAPGRAASPPPAKAPSAPAKSYSTPSRSSSSSSTSKTR